MQPCPFPPLSMNILELKPSAWWEKTWTRQRLRADVGARSNFKSKHLIAYGSGMRGKLFSFHVSGARPWCQCTPAVNQGLIYAWQQLWMLNEDPLQVHAHTHTYTQQHTLLAYCQRLLWLWSESEVTWLQKGSGFFPILTLQGGKQHLTVECSRLQHNAEPEQIKESHYTSEWKALFLLQCMCHSDNVVWDSHLLVPSENPHIWTNHV